MAKNEHIYTERSKNTNSKPPKLDFSKIEKERETVNSANSGGKTGFEMHQINFHTISSNQNNLSNLDEIKSLDGTLGNTHQ
jgi:hypothetical protein